MLHNRSMSQPLTIVWLAIFIAALVWSGVAPKDYPTWVLEVFPALVGIVVMAWTFQRFPLTPLVYWLILVHSIILMIGGHYTYAEVPLGDWLGHVLGETRNNYDKLGHFAQGFVPALIAREILLRRRIVNGRGWTHFITVCICLAISAFYELIEWMVAMLSGQAADAFLGTQGYVWDTQSDMAWCLVGALTAIIILARLHDGQIARLVSRDADTASST